jgi:hypothetical protein
MNKKASKLPWQKQLFLGVIFIILIPVIIVEVLRALFGGGVWLSLGALGLATILFLYSLTRR